MAYPRDKLASAAEDLLRRHPRWTADEVSQELGVHRHTLRRALVAEGLSVEALRRKVICDCLRGHLASPAPRPWKQLWAELGFSSGSAFARYVRRTTGKSPGELVHAERKRATMGLDLLGGVSEAQVVVPDLFAQLHRPGLRFLLTAVACALAAGCMPVKSQAPSPAESAAAVAKMVFLQAHAAVAQLPEATRPFAGMFIARAELAHLPKLGIADLQFAFRAAKALPAPDLQQMQSAGTLDGKLQLLTQAQWKRSTEVQVIIALVALKHSKTATELARHSDIPEAYLMRWVIEPELAQGKYAAALQLAQECVRDDGSFPFALGIWPAARHDAYADEFFQQGMEVARSLRDPEQMVSAVQDFLQPNAARLQPGELKAIYQGWMDRLDAKPANPLQAQLDEGVRNAVGPALGTLADAGTALAAHNAPPIAAPGPAPERLLPRNAALQAEGSAISDFGQLAEKVGKGADPEDAMPAAGKALAVLLANPEAAVRASTPDALQLVRYFQQVQDPVDAARAASAVVNGLNLMLEAAQARLRGKGTFALEQQINHKFAGRRGGALYLQALDASGQPPLAAVAGAPEFARPFVLALAAESMLDRAAAPPPHPSSHLQK